MAAHTSSVQDFGLNHFSQPHSIGGDANLGQLIPIFWDDVPFGSTIDNNVDLFTRSSPLVDPAFLDCDISVGHYFVSYEALDPIFKVRARNFKRTTENVEMLQFVLPINSLYQNAPIGANIAPEYGPGTLFDRLGLSLAPNLSKLPSGNPATYFNFYPFSAYHTICDWFFTNRHVQNCYRMQEATLQMMQNNPDGHYFTPAQIEAAFTQVDSRFGYSNLTDMAYDFMQLRSCNFEPDYFTTARPKPGANDVYLPGTTQNSAPATVRNLLDSELMQKVADMLYNGGYSLNDLVRTIYGYELGDSVTETPIFLGGTTKPLQVSTVTQTSVGSDDTPLGTQAGTVSGYANGDNRIHYTATRAGIYMVLLWIRPKVYYTSGINKKCMNRYFGDFLIPQLADASNEPIIQGELTGNILDFMTQGGNEPAIFGYTDRYENYRTKINRATGTLRTTRTSWLNTRNFTSSLGSAELAINPKFLDMQDQVNYNPWVITDKKVPHFFFRAYLDYAQTNLLPVRSRPWVW